MVKEDFLPRTAPQWVGEKPGSMQPGCDVRWYWQDLRVPGAPYHFRPEWRVDLLPFQLFPIDLPKQGVLTDVSPHPQPLLRLSYEELKGSRRGAVTSHGMNQAPQMQGARTTWLDSTRRGVWPLPPDSRAFFFYNCLKLSTLVKLVQTGLLNIAESELCSRNAIF